MIGDESASAFVTCGSLMFSGSRERTRLTRSRTSFAASSMFLSVLNSIVMFVRCSADDDRSVRMPSIEESSFSSGSVTFDSITSAEAPASLGSTDTIGESMLGYSRTGSRANIRPPTSTMKIEATTQTTGRLMDRSDSSIG